MRHAKEEFLNGTELQVIDITSVVKELHGLSSQELGKLIKDSETNTIQCATGNGSPVQIDVEKLAKYLPLHLNAKLISSERDEVLLRYLLCGFRLLHSFCDLAPRHSKLEQILLDDVKVSEQLLDLVFYLLIALGGYGQENHYLSPIPLVHPTLIACSLYLLTGCISSQWPDLAHVLLAHPKVDIFMDAAFAAVCADIKFIQMKLSTPCTDFTVEETLTHLFQQCEASLQFLQSLCQQKMFRERLVKNKELCGKGGILLLARAILSLNAAPVFSESYSIVAAISRLKAKVLSILLHLCEESVTYLDEVASTPRMLDLAKSVALEVLEMLNTMFNGDPKQLSACSDRTYPKGLLQLNAMRLADIFSDDSNFRPYITVYFTEALTAIFTLPHRDFLSNWCSSNLPICEEDVTLEYDPFVAAGWILDSFSQSDSSNAANSVSSFVPSNMSRASYAHQRTSLLVKVIANLHCFVPGICKEEKDLFLNNFLECLQKKLPKLSDGLSFTSDIEKAAIVSRNLRSLLSHAESLIPNFLNEDDVQLLRVFFNQLESLMTPAESEVNRVQESKLSKFEVSVNGDKLPKFSSSQHHQVAPDPTNRSSNLKEGMSENSAFQEVDQFYVRSNYIDQADDVERTDKRKDIGKPAGISAKGLREIDRDIENIETSGSDSSTTREKNSNDQMEMADCTKSSENIKKNGFQGGQGEKVGTVQYEEKQQRKRKRSIMNPKQVTLIENALMDEPDMQRHAALVQSWADKLSVHGSEVTTSQLKNWLNNRKARLARAAKDTRLPSEEENTFQDKESGPGIVPYCDSPETPVGDMSVRGTHQSGISETTLRTSTSGNMETEVGELNEIVPTEYLQCEPGQYVVLLDERGEELGKGKVYQAQGQWYGWRLEESQVCIVDVMELKAERWARLPHPCEATGNTFAEAETKLGFMRVLWDSNKLFMLQPR